MKPAVNTIAGIAVIYRLANPQEIFTSRKTAGHPTAHAREKLCCIGGNWVDDGARADANTLATLQRELREELTLDKHVATTAEAVTIGLTDTVESYEIGRAQAPTEEDRAALAQLVEAFVSAAKPFGDICITVTEAALRAADSENERPGFTSLCSFYLIGVNEENWAKLVALQERYGNLSNESLTLITSLPEILAKDDRFAFGHDQVMRAFWREQWYGAVEEMSIIPHIEFELIGMPLDTYAEYLEKFEVARRP